MNAVFFWFSGSRAIWWYPLKTSKKLILGCLMQHRRVEAESITHKYYNSSTKPKFYKNTRLIGKIIEKTFLANFYSKNTHNNNLSIKSIYKNRISPTLFRKRNNKPTSTWERKSNLTRKRKTIKIPIQLGKGF